MDWWRRLSRGKKIGLIVVAVFSLGLLSSALGLGDEEEAPDSATSTTTGTESPSATPTQASPASDGSLFVPDLDPGDCLQEFGEDSFSVPKVDCDEPHMFEVTGFHELAGEDDVYPTSIEMEDASRGPCEDAFAAHVGAASNQSNLLSLPLLYPTAQGWANGHREVICVALAADGALLEGSARGQG